MEKPKAGGNEESSIRGEHQVQEGHRHHRGFSSQGRVARLYDYETLALGVTLPLQTIQTNRTLHSHSERAQKPRDLGYKPQCQSSQSDALTGSLSMKAITRQGLPILPSFPSRKRYLFNSNHRRKASQMPFVGKSSV